MSNGCTIVRVYGVDFDAVPPKYDYQPENLPNNGTFGEDAAKRGAWTLAYDVRGAEFGVLEGDELLQTYLVEDWVS